MPLPRHLDVFESIEHEFDRFSQEGGTKRRHRRPMRTLLLLTAKATSKPFHIDFDLVYRLS